MGIEPMTSSLPRKRSTPELHRRKVFCLPLYKGRSPAFYAHRQTAEIV
jgi:hypothetical protein